MGVCVHGQREWEKAQGGGMVGVVERGCCLGKSSEESCFSGCFSSGRHTSSRLQEEQVMGPPLSTVLGSILLQTP